jgi:hypothetical protein
MDVVKQVDERMFKECFENGWEQLDIEPFVSILMKMKILKEKSAGNSSKTTHHQHNVIRILHAASKTACTYSAACPTQAHRTTICGHST